MREEEVRVKGKYRLLCIRKGEKRIMIRRDKE